MPGLRGLSRKYDDESDVMLGVAGSYGVDARFLAAVREAEGGGPGREYGVLNVGADTYQQQAEWAAGTIAKNVTRYQASPTGGPAIGADGRYTDGFIAFFSGRYAPVGAANDPGQLNVNHYGNLIAAYRRIDYA